MSHHHHEHTRRDFFAHSFKGILAGATVFEEAFLRASWARAQSVTASTTLFSIEKVADGVYAALAEPQIMTNCNAAIFVLSRDVLVVDAHSKPSAAAALIAQIRKEVTDKPVRYLVNSHFHWDHTQGDAAYKSANPGVEIIASEATKQLMTELGRDRLKESLESVLGMIDTLKERLARATTAQERQWVNEQLRQLEAYQQEMKSYPLELPTVTFGNTHVIQDPSGDLHIEFHGRAHTAGDIQVFSPAKKALASGDTIIGFLPNINDGYPRSWVKNHRLHRGTAIRQHCRRPRCRAAWPRPHDAVSQLHRRPHKPRRARQESGHAPRRIAKNYYRSHAPHTARTRLSRIRRRQPRALLGVHRFEDGSGGPAVCQHSGHLPEPGSGLIQMKRSLREAEG